MCVCVCVCVCMDATAVGCHEYGHVSCPCWLTSQTQVCVGFPLLDQVHRNRTCRFSYVWKRTEFWPVTATWKSTVSGFISKEIDCHKLSLRLSLRLKSMANIHVYVLKISLLCFFSCWSCSCYTISSLSSSHKNRLCWHRNLCHDFLVLHSPMKHATLSSLSLNLPSHDQSLSSLSSMIGAFLL
jgi:hypothetical protein